MGEPDTMSPQLITLFIFLSFIGAAKVEEQYKKESPVEMNSGIYANGTETTNIDSTNHIAKSQECSCSFQDYWAELSDGALAAIIIIVIVVAILIIILFCISFYFLYKCMTSYLKNTSNILSQF